MAIELQLCPVHNRLFTHGACGLCAATLPPGAEDEAAAEFEARIAADGESRARWDRLLELLEGSKGETHEKP